MASERYGREIKKGDCERNLGKVMILACQYGQWAKSFKEQCFNMGIDISLQEAKKCVMAYRKKYKKVVAEWDRYDNLILDHFKSGEELKVELLSGRFLNYGKIGFKKVVLGGRAASAGENQLSHFIMKTKKIRKRLGAREKYVLCYNS